MMLVGALRKSVEKILDHPYGSLRIRYWKKDGRTAWILEEIGKVEQMPRLEGKRMTMFISPKKK